MLLGSLVGVLAGLASALLNAAVHALEHWRHGLSHEWWLFVLPGVGALLGILLQRKVFRDHAGHGVPDVIQSVTTGRGVLPRRLLFSRLVSSCLTVGLGGAAGLEGPIVVSGAAAGSLVARLFRLAELRRILLIACGTAGAIAGIFNAPLTGLIFSLEVILGEWKARNLVPTVTAAAVATQVSRMLMGNKIPFPRETLVHGFHDLPAFAVLGICCAGVGWVFVHVLKLAERRFAAIPLPSFVVAGLGGLLVGLLAWIQPDVMGEGYGLIRAYLHGDMSGGLTLVALILALRILATGLTLGSGGAGGVFAPSLVIGSSTGLLFGHLLSWLDPLQAFAAPRAYALVGMAGLVAAIMNAPLTGIFLVLEISGSYDLILPLMVCCLGGMLCWRLVYRGSIYTQSLISKGEFKPRGTEEQLLSEVTIDEILEPCLQIQAEMTLGEFISRHGDLPDDVFALVNGDGEYQGLLFLEDLRPYLFDTEMHTLITLTSVREAGLPVLHPDDPADRALQAFSQTRRRTLPVLHPAGEVCGTISKTGLFDLTRRELAAHQEV